MKELDELLQRFKNTEYYQEIKDLLLEIFDVNQTVDIKMLCVMLQCNLYNPQRLIRALRRLLETYRKYI